MLNVNFRIRHYSVTSVLSKLLLGNQKSSRSEGSNKYKEKSKVYIKETHLDEINTKIDPHGVPFKTKNWNGKGCINLEIYFMYNLQVVAAPDVELCEKTIKNLRNVETKDLFHKSITSK